VADATAWLVGADELPADSHPLGRPTGKSGPGSVFAAATGNLAQMAVEEINADGGICGRPVRH
jgi:branched-chain amino acid transport system substrate-binding protein